MTSKLEKNNNSDSRAWRFPPGRQADYTKTQKLGATTCAAWRQFMHRQAVSGKIPENATEPGFKAFTIQP
ncbi:hypothetical protein DEO72_LG4g321 [Vigna unguiculata]|uniref:Uncharacterized protein n=1 Tax=Vigna unguiculata TaxID=3917 RepID=A0A4D6LLB2_VIGUN|nr:hypothetical protein DEO72_LG4g321 [Vigna unguiculata]